MVNLLSPRSPFLAVLTVGAILFSFLVPDAKLFERPELARILFWHLPCPLLGSVLVFLGSWFSFRALRAEGVERRRWDVRAASAMELGMTFSVLTLLTGILFSLVQWGAAWQWDPRQTSYAIYALVYLAYFALRASFSDADARAQHAASYSLAAFLPGIFLVYVYPRLPQVVESSIHPTNTISGGLLKGNYAYCAIVTVLTVALLAIAVYRARVQAGLLDLEIGSLEDARGDSAAPRVRRPVALPPQG